VKNALGAISGFPERRRARDVSYDRRQDAAPKKRQPVEQQAEIVTDRDEEGVGGTTIAAGEEVAVHPVVGLSCPILGSTAERLLSSRLICCVTAMFGFQRREGN